MDKTSKSKSKIPTWAIIVIIILVILVILIPIITWFAASALNSGPSGGVGTKCSGNANCATGLVCSAGTCGVPECQKPEKVTGISHEATINFPGWDIALSWTAAAGATFYLIFVGLDDGFDPFSESVFTTVIDTNSFDIPDVAANSTAYLRILGVSQDCGTNQANISDQYTLTTDPIMI